jgi:hypothetical protein
MYYFNRETHESVWARPDDFVENAVDEATGGGTVFPATEWANPVVWVPFPAPPSKSFPPFLCLPDAPPLYLAQLELTTAEHTERRGALSDHAVERRMHVLPVASGLTAPNPTEASAFGPLHRVHQEQILVLHPQPKGDIVHTSAAKRPKSQLQSGTTSTAVALTDSSERDALIDVHPFMANSVTVVPSFGIPRYDWKAGCCVGLQPDTGRLIELIIKGCGLCAELEIISSKLSCLTTIVR